ncbi:hypothetical protein BDN70DRAFT_903846 [Pholiota conissans]|uniref:non-specific serine/threonine protein kinase n=1 Tax=Pholiota conissans TaxID=109636 RepID=A0A9P5ZDS0_9AGAR|nr:hypothetical protein BDN70DRAFT_903846 [Pholiota conissans]
MALLPKLGRHFPLSRLGLPAQYYYPVRIGQLFNSEYRVIGKLGYGGYSTTAWLFKICTHDAPAVKRKLEIFRYFNTLSTANLGGLLVRTMLEEFDPLSANIAHFRSAFRNRRLPLPLMKLLLVYILHGVDFLHTEAKVTHGGTYGRPIFGFTISALEEFEREEQTDPSPRKIDHLERVIYTSRELVPKEFGHPVLCNFGETRLGQSTYTDRIQPFQYRAPENEKVNIWNVGVMDIFEDKNMLETRGGPKNERSNLLRLAHMIVLLVAPLQDLVRGTRHTPWRYFDAGGDVFIIMANWKDEVEIPDTILESLEEKLDGEDKA